MIAYVGHVEKQTRENADFRRVLFTGKHAQLVVICLEPGEQIGDEVHQNVDQFFRIEQGAARFVFNEGSEHSPWWRVAAANTLTQSVGRLRAGARPMPSVWISDRESHSLLAPRFSGPAESVAGVLR